MRKLPDLSKSYIGKSNTLVFRNDIDYPIDYAFNRNSHILNIDLNKEYCSI